MAPPVARVLLTPASMRLRHAHTLALVLGLGAYLGLAEAGAGPVLAHPGGGHAVDTAGLGSRSPRSRRAVTPGQPLGASVARGRLGQAAQGGGKLSIGARALALPPSARVRELAAETFVAVERAFEVHKETIDYSGIPLEAAQLRGLRAAAEKTLGVLPRSKVVVYPMSGYDAGSPIHLFPDATTIIGLDNHPFVPPGEARGKIPYTEVGTHNFAYYADVDRLGHVGPALIGALSRAVPGFHLRGVTLIENDDLAELRRGWAREVAPTAPNVSAVHAVIEFDAGPGTPVRRYIHINASLVAGAAVEQTWWWKAIDKLRPEAVLLKASEHVFDSERGMARALRPAVLGWLQRSSGVLIEDQDRWGRHNAAAFSDLVNQPDPTATDARRYQNWVPSYPGGRSARVPLDKFHFGYTDARGSILVTAFDR